MNRPRTRALVAPLLAALLLTAGCGSEPTSASKVQEDTAAVVQALNAKDYPAARRALATLDSDLAAAGRLDQLEAETVTKLRAGVATLKADLALVSPLATPTPTRRPTTAPPVMRDEPKKKHGKHD